MSLRGVLISCDIVDSREGEGLLIEALHFVFVRNRYAMDRGVGKLKGRFAAANTLGRGGSVFWGGLLFLLLGVFGFESNAFYCHLIRLIVSSWNMSRTSRVWMRKTNSDRMDGALRFRRTKVYTKFQNKLFVNYVSICYRKLEIGFTYTSYCCLFILLMSILLQYDIIIHVWCLHTRKYNYNRAK